MTAASPDLNRPEIALAAPTLAPASLAPIAQPPTLVLTDPRVTAGGVAPPWTADSANALVWTFATDSGPLRQALAATPFDLAAWRQAGWATPVQGGSNRTIYQIRLPGLTCLLKHFHPPTRLRRGLSLVTESPGRREFRHLRRLRERGLAVPSPWALAERRQWGAVTEAFLVTDWLADAETLYAWVERGTAAPAERRAVCRQFARLLAHWHDAGLEHRDLHARNVLLVRDDAPTPVGWAMPTTSQPAAAESREPKMVGSAHPTRAAMLESQASGGLEPTRLVVIDSETVLTHAGPLGAAAARRELAQIGRYFTLRSSRTDRQRFWREYLQARRPSAQRDQLMAETTAPAMETATSESRAQFWLHRDGKDSQSRLPVRRAGRGPVAALFHRDLPPDLADRLLTNPDDPFGAPLLRWFKDDKNTRVAEVAFAELAEGTPVVYKEFRFKGWHEALGALFRPSQAVRAWRGANSLLIREIPTPRPWALVRQTWCGLTVRSFLLTDRVAGGKPLSHYVRDDVARLPRREQRATIATLIERAATLLRDLHQRGVSHEDLKAANLLVTPDQQLVVIDLDGVRTWRRVPRRHVIQNLARLNVSFHDSPFVSRTDRLRFLRRYLGLAFSHSAEWKTIWRAVAAYTAWKVNRNRRRGRPVG